MAFLVRRTFGRQKKRNEELRATGEKPASGMQAFVSGMGIRRNGSRDSRAEPEASRPETTRNPPEMTRNLSVPLPVTNEALDRAEMGTVRVPSTISSGWGDGLSIHSLKINENEPVQGLGIRPQTRPPPARDEDESEGTSFYEAINYRRDPFADPEPEIGGLEPIDLPTFDFDRYRNDNPRSPGDLTRDYLKSRDGRTAPPSLTSEI